MTIFLFILNGLLVYLSCGMIVVIITAYLRKLLLNENWFTKTGWDGDWQEGHYIVPAAMLVLWPIVILFSIIVFVVGGVMRGVAAVAKKAEVAAEKQRKRVGDHRDNP